MQLQQMQFFENMQKTQAQYLDELKALKTKQDEMHPQENNFYRQIRKEQGEMTKEIEEIKKFQVNQTLMGFRASPIEKLKERSHTTQGGPSQPSPPSKPTDTPMEDAEKES
ncbi:hypothetical protein PIB30_070669 [Stylosanthes scabra]|uniref:Uncharacterized protein n=1 Tax=Stylosanthes scabra TaxID=79078 RepID=A0ABU6WQ69_9FABA|nr:hypothetical protein [Stylosanthes scabra]